MHTILIDTQLYTQRWICDKFVRVLVNSTKSSYKAGNGKYEGQIKFPPSVQKLSI